VKAQIWDTGVPSIALSLPYLPLLTVSHPPSVLGSQRGRNDIVPSPQRASPFSPMGVTSRG
jgi:hypothetical protein